MIGAEVYRPYELTAITRSSFAAACREVLRSAGLYHLRWRHHGLGMLQGELSADLRVHVWHPLLRTLPVDGFRDVHDHRFTLLSYVAAGELVDVPFSVVKVEGSIGWDRNPTAEVHEIVHAKEQEAVKKGCSTATLARRIGSAYVQQEETKTYRAGDVYAIARRCFHTTRVEKLAVTVVHRTDFDGKLARVLGLSGDGDVGSAIVPETNDSYKLRLRVLEEARTALRAELA